MKERYGAYALAEKGDAGTGGFKEFSGLDARPLALRRLRRRVRSRGRLWRSPRGKKRVPADPGERVAFYERLVVDQPESPSRWRSLANAYVQTGQFTLVPLACRKAAQGTNGSRGRRCRLVLENLAQRYTPEARIYVTRPASVKPRWKLAKNRPAVGCYIGAFVEHGQPPIGYADDYNIRRRDGRVRQEPGREPRPSSLNYFQVQPEVPRRWIEHLKGIGAAPRSRGARAPRQGAGRLLSARVRPRMPAGRCPDLPALRERDERELDLLQR